MSLIEKMTMWASGAEGGSPEPLVSLPELDWLEGVEDEIEDASTHLDLPLYSQAILNSEAYKLLLEDLRREASLHSDTSRVWTMDTVRHQIMNGLSPARISKNQDPCIHDVEFLVPLRGIKQRLSREDMKWAFNRDGAYDPTKILVLVNSCNNYTQAVTVEEYVGQAWGSRGSKLLDLIKAICAQNFETVNSYCKMDLSIVIDTKLHDTFN
jgi:hypothetical protein